MSRRKVRAKWRSFLYMAIDTQHAPHEQRQQQHVTFGRIAWVFRVALALGTGGGFLLACVLTLSSMFGLPLGAWWVALAQAHGSLQVFGWAGLFVVGVSLHFLPRLRGAPLIAVRPLHWFVGVLAGALCLRALAQPLLAWNGARVFWIALAGSGLLQCLALLGIVLLLGLTLRRGPALSTRPAFVQMLPLLSCAFISLGLTGIINLVNVWQATGIIAPFPDRVYVTLGLFGFLLPMALGLSARSLPMYAGLEAFPPRRLFVLVCAYLSGLVVDCLGIVGTWQGAEGVGMLLLGASLLSFVTLFLLVMRKRGRLPQKVERLAPRPGELAQAYRSRVTRERGTYGPFVALVASAYLWAALGGLLLLLNGLSALLGFPLPVAEDVIRHSLTVGFISLLICGLAPRMLPGFSGGQIRSAKLVGATLWLGNGAALLRVGSLLLAPWLFVGPLNLGRIAFGCSGILGLALAFCLAFNLWPALHRTKAI